MRRRRSGEGITHRSQRGGGGGRVAGIEDPVPLAVEPVALGVLDLPSGVDVPIGKPGGDHDRVRDDARPCILPLGCGDPRLDGEEPAGHAIPLRRLAASPDLTRI